MQPPQRAAELRRRIGYLTALTETREALIAQSDNLLTWRQELEAQGFGSDELPDVLITDAKWFKASGRTSTELLDELKAELPKAQQLEEEHRVEVARRTTGERYWDIPMTLAWVRFRDVKRACRFLERRDALVSLWRDGLETNELEQSLASGELIATGVRAGLSHEINAAEWANQKRDGLRLIRDTDPCAGRRGERAAYRQLRLPRQAVQFAFPSPQKSINSDTPFLAAARTYLAHGEGRVGWDMLWRHVSDKLGVSVSKRRRERLELILRPEFPHRFGRGALKRK